MSNSLFVFPDAPVIAAALTVANDDAWLQERLYPAIAGKFADKELVEAGVDLRFEMAMYDLRKADAGDNQVYGLLQAIGTLDEVKDALKGCATQTTREERGSHREHEVKESEVTSVETNQPEINKSEFAQDTEPKQDMIDAGVLPADDTSADTNLVGISDLDDMMNRDIRRGQEFLKDQSEGFKGEVSSLYDKRGAFMGASDFKNPAYRATWKKLEKSIDSEGQHSGASFSWALAKVIGSDFWRPPTLTIKKAE